jgi:methylated-DNA-[protein]-cysteine S-methyltransferase
MAETRMNMKPGDLPSDFAGDLPGRFPHGFVYGRALSASGDGWAALFPTDLGWMACLWGRDRLLWNSFGFDTDGTARHAVWAAARSEFAFTIDAWLIADEAGEAGEADEAHEADDVASSGCPERLLAIASRLARFAETFSDRFLDVPLSLQHLGPFTQRVVEACRAIPPGQTASYADLAAQAGSPKAARAVGNAMARNRFPLIVPCHRVVGAGGNLGGYSAPQGLAMKRRLLECETRESGRDPRLTWPFPRTEGGDDSRPRATTD